MIKEYAQIMMFFSKFIGKHSAPEGEQIPLHRIYQQTKEKAHDARCNLLFHGLRELGLSEIERLQEELKKG